MELLGESSDILLHRWVEHPRSVWENPVQAVKVGVMPIGNTLRKLVIKSAPAKRHVITREAAWISIMHQQRADRNPRGKADEEWKARDRRRKLSLVVQWRRINMHFDRVIGNSHGSLDLINAGLVLIHFFYPSPYINSSRYKWSQTCWTSMHKKYSALFTSVNLLLGVGPLILPMPFFDTGIGLSLLWMVAILGLSYLSAMFIS